MTFVDRTIHCRVCGKVRFLRQHHVMYRQAVRRAGGDQLDPDNALGVCDPCHGRHHNRKAVIQTSKLRDQNLEFIVALIGPCPAFEYLRTYYAGTHADIRVGQILALCGQ